MTKLRCVRKIQFCSGHRILNHESKCANLHGHNYVCWFYAEADKLDPLGRVIDFSILKEKIGGWIDENWDHNLLIYSEDKVLVSLKDSLTVNKKAYICPFNTTAENLAQYLIDEICPSLLKNLGVKITKIKMFETENCFVEVYSR